MKKIVLIIASLLIFPTLIGTIEYMYKREFWHVFLINGGCVDAILAIIVIFIWVVFWSLDIDTKIKNFLK